MTTLMPDLQKALARAVETSEQAPKRSATRWRVATAVTVGGLLAAGAATAAVTTIWQPEGPELEGRTITVDPTAPPAAQLELLAVLRRPADEQDRGARTLAALRYGPQSIRANYVRLVARADSSGGFALVPVWTRDGQAIDGQPSDTLADALCLVLPTERGGGSTCQTTEQIAAGQLLMVASGRAYGVVPDGVTTVRRTDERTGITTTARVDNNAFVLPATGLSAPSIEWKDANGNVVRKAHNDTNAPPNVPRE